MWGGGGGTLIFSYIHIYVGFDPFLGLKILNFNNFGVFQKDEYFWGTKLLWIFFGGHLKNGLFFWGHFYAF